MNYVAPTPRLIYFTISSNKHGSRKIYLVEFLSTAIILRIVIAQNQHKSLQGAIGTGCDSSVSDVAVSDIELTQESYVESSG
jgi:hypothetical protein